MIGNRLTVSAHLLADLAQGMPRLSASSITECVPSTRQLLSSSLSKPTVARDLSSLLTQLGMAQYIGECQGTYSNNCLIQTTDLNSYKRIKFLSTAMA